MNKSVIIKTPVVVSDPNLKKLNDVQFSLSETWEASPSDGSYNILYVKGDAAQIGGRKIRIVGGTAHFTNNNNTADYGQEVTLASTNDTQQFYISSGTGTILADIREQVKRFDPPYGRRAHLTGDVNYMPNLQSFNWVGVTLEDGFSVDVNRRLTEIRVSARENPEIISVGPDYFEGLVLDTLSLTPGDDTFVVSGDIEDFGQYHRLGLLRLKGTGVTGTAESLFDKMHENGRVSGQIKAYLNNTSVTYNSSPCPSVLTVNFNSSGWYLVT